MSGFFGCVSKKECVSEVYYGTDYHSHLGTSRGGMAFYKEEKIVRSIHSLENAYFRNKFEPDLYKFRGAKMGFGIISDSESQPITLTSHLGQFALATVGRVDNVEELAQELVENKVTFSELSGSEINPTELVAILISMCDTFEEGIEYVQKRVKGSCSMLIMTSKGIYAVRDKLGRTAVMLGEGEDGYAVVSESSALTNLGFEPLRELGAGEVVMMTPEKIEQIKPPNGKMQVCAFLWVYYGYPSSYYEGINVEATRYEAGCALAQRDKDIKDLDLVAGIPDSGIGHAVGYSNCKHVPYQRAFVKYTPTWPRSFMPKDQAARSIISKMKLIPNETFIKGKKLAVVDDSMVRGTQLTDNASKLKECGSKEVHIRLSCPPIIFPCSYINFSTSRTTTNLITRRVIKELEGIENPSDEILEDYADQNSQRYANMVEYIRNILGVDSLKFQHIEDLVEAIGLPKEKLCTHCWDNSSYF